MSSQSPELEERKIYNFYGQMLMRYFLNKDRHIEGDFETWHSNGKLCSSLYYVNGKGNGKCKRWHENGRLEMIEFYQDGKREGERKIWDEDTRTVVLHEFYRNGKVEGEGKIWYSTGNLAAHHYWKDNTLIGDFGRERFVFLNIKRNLYFRNKNQVIHTFLISDLENLLFK